jgi:hypothetical protein
VISERLEVNCNLSNGARASAVADVLVDDTVNKASIRDYSLTPKKHPEFKQGRRKSTILRNDGCEIAWRIFGVTVENGVFEVP